MNAVDRLLDRDTPADDLARAAEELYAALSSPVSSLLDDSGAGTQLPDGLAIAPSLAATCTKDAVRTAVFLRAVHDALEDTLRRLPDRIVEVVYAGTGPLAPLAIPLLPRFAGRPLRCTFLDVHRQSVQASRIVAAAFGVTVPIDFVEADATRYRHPRPIDLLITETMQRALTREPQVAVVRNLAPQLAPGGILVPESVRVELFGQTLLDLRAGNAADPLPAVEIRIPDDAAEFPLSTFITAYRDHVIGPYQSGLTYPYLAWELMPITPGGTLTLRYEIGPDPRFVRA